MACNRFLSSMARTKMSEEGQLLDEGCDLNMEGGLAEYVVVDWELVFVRHTDCEPVFVRHA